MAIKEHVLARIGIISFILLFDFLCAWVWKSRSDKNIGEQVTCQSESLAMARQGRTNLLFGLFALWYFFLDLTKSPKDFFA